MKRDEKNLISRRKILDSAFAEFGTRGYGMSSVNTICTAGDISKGILYHYFRDKDELYLSCVQELFEGLTEHLGQALADVSGTQTAQLERYFDARLDFFQTRPLHHRLFCDVVMGPPPHLAAGIGTLRAPFDQLNISVLTTLLQTVKLRPGLTVPGAVDTFRLYQDFVNARVSMDAEGKIDLAHHEALCRRSLDVLLYGVVEREVL